jgi:hypothetical protein
VFEGETTGSPGKESNNAEVDPSGDDTSGPDLTCSEQLPTNCASPDPYTGDFPEGERFYQNGVENESVDARNRSKEKDSSSSLDEAKVSYYDYEIFPAKMIFTFLLTLTTFAVIGSYKRQSKNLFIAMFNFACAIQY